jgi:hypothetical protein
MNCDEPHLTSNEKTQLIQWTKQPTSALVVASSLWLEGCMVSGQETILCLVPIP